jgi:hypothetical protein
MPLALVWARMGLAVRVDRVGQDRHGAYALATLDGVQKRYDLDLLVNIVVPETRF